MPYGLEGALIRLAPIDPERHTEPLQRWINDPETSRTLGGGTFPTSLLGERDFTERAARSDRDGVFWAIETLGGELVGISDLHKIDWIARSAHSGSFIGAPENRGKGYGAEAARLRAAYAFGTLNLLTLFSSHLDGNPASGRMLQKAGYERWGVRPRAFYKEGRLTDEHNFLLTRERWESLRDGAR